MSAMKLAARRREERLLAGVCSAIGERYALDVTLVRLGFLLLAFAWGAGLVLYAGLWVLLPEEGSPSRGLRATALGNLAAIPDQLAGSARAFSSAWKRQERQERRSWPRPLDRRWIAIALVAAGLGVLLVSFGALAWLTPMRAIGVAVICVGAGALWSLRGG